MQARGMAKTPASPSNLRRIAHFLLFIHLESSLNTLVVMAAEASKKCA